MNPPKVVYTIGDQVFRALPKPPTRTVAMIAQCRDADEAMLRSARMATLRAYRMFAQEWRVVVGDGHGIDAEIARTCITWGIPLLVCGTAAAPCNGTPRRFYQRVIATGTHAAKAEARNQYLIALADRVIYFNQET